VRQSNQRLDQQFPEQTKTRAGARRNRAAQDHQFGSLTIVFSNAVSRHNSAAE